MLSYQLLDLPWQQRLGGWHYLVAVALMVGTSIPLRLWHPDPRPGSSSASAG
jgi:hypothetical protein